MTLQEAQEKVAKNNGWEDWNQIYYSADLSQHSKDILFISAAELYAKAKYEEGYASGCQEAQSTGVLEAHKYQ